VSTHDKISNPASEGAGSMKKSTYSLKSSCLAGYHTGGHHANGKLGQEPCLPHSALLFWLNLTTKPYETTTPVSCGNDLRRLMTWISKARPPIVPTRLSAALLDGDCPRRACRTPPCQRPSSHPTSSSFRRNPIGRPQYFNSCPGGVGCELRQQQCGDHHQCLYALFCLVCARTDTGVFLLIQIQVNALLPL
jgi:hypothetical protein